MPTATGHTTAIRAKKVIGTSVKDTSGEKIGTRISGQCVFTIPHLRNIWNSGTIVTSLGIRRPSSTTMKSRLAPGNLIRAKA